MTIASSVFKGTRKKSGTRREHGFPKEPGSFESYRVFQRIGYPVIPERTGYPKELSVFTGTRKNRVPDRLSLDRFRKFGTGYARYSMHIDSVQLYCTRAMHCVTVSISVSAVPTEIE